MRVLQADVRKEKQNIDDTEAGVAAPNAPKPQQIKAADQRAYLFGDSLHDLLSMLLQMLHEGPMMLLEETGLRLLSSSIATKLGSRIFCTWDLGLHAGCVSISISWLVGGQNLLVGSLCQ